MTSQTQRLRELLVVDTLAVTRIPINTCTVEELAAHPYARWSLAIAGAANLAFMVTAASLAVFKPWGRIRKR